MQIEASTMGTGGAFIDDDITIRVTGCRDVRAAHLRVEFTGNEQKRIAD